MDYYTDSYVRWSSGCVGVTFNISQQLYISWWDIWPLPEYYPHWLWNTGPLLGQDPGRNNKPHPTWEATFADLGQSSSCLYLYLFSQPGFTASSWCPDSLGWGIWCWKESKECVLNQFCQSAGQLTLEQEGINRMVHLYTGFLLRRNTESVFSFPYDFLNSFFSLAYLIVIIVYYIYNLQHMC